MLCRHTNLYLISLQSYKPELLANKPIIFTDQPILLPHFTILFSDEPELLTHESKLQPNISILQPD